MKTFALTLAAVLLTSGLVFSQYMDPEVNKLPVYGMVTFNGKQAKNPKVKIYKGNLLVTELTPKRGEFDVMLDLGNYYTIEVEAEGYVAKRVAFDLIVDKKTLKPPYFDCAVDLIPTTMVRGKDASILDFPIARIAYDAKKRSFEPVIEYSMNMMRLYGEVLADN